MATSACSQVRGTCGDLCTHQGMRGLSTEGAFSSEATQLRGETAQRGELTVPEERAPRPRGQIRGPEIQVLASEPR